MGKNTFLSLPENCRPLKNRLNIVLTRDPYYYINNPEYMQHPNLIFTDDENIHNYIQQNREKIYEIYSEIRQNFQKSTQKNQEVLDSLAYNVELHVQYFEEDGEKIPYTSTGHRIMSWGNHPTFFVCPETGRLKQAKHRSFKYKKSDPKDFREIDGKTYKEKDGIWYEVVLVVFWVPKVLL
mgnify:CR=1 FL=1